MTHTYIWQQFTERARAAVYFAEQHAVRLGCEYIEPEHLMLGLIEDQGNVASRLLDRMDVPLTQLRSQLELQSPKALEVSRARSFLRSVFAS